MSNPVWILSKACAGTTASATTPKWLFSQSNAVVTMQTTLGSPPTVTVF